MDTTTTWPLDELDVDVEDEADEEEAPPTDAPPNEPPPLVPLDPVPPVDDPEPELADDDELVTCWPTVRLTEATVPEMVDTKVPLVALVWAVVTWVCAEAMLALSRAIWVDDALAVSSVASCAWSLANVAWAWARAALSAVGSTVARV